MQQAAKVRRRKYCQEIYEGRYQEIDPHRVARGITHRIHLTQEDCKKLRNRWIDFSIESRIDSQTTKSPRSVIASRASLMLVGRGDRTYNPLIKSQRVEARTHRHLWAIGALQSQARRPMRAQPRIDAP